MGFGHNWASSINNRASVMEYPTPRVKVTGDRLDLSEAFEPTTGLYDDFIDPLRLHRARSRQGARGARRDHRGDAGEGTSSTCPRPIRAGCWYDDRATPTEYLRETMAARKIMLAQYGPAILQAGEPIGSLRDCGCG